MEAPPYNISFHLIFITAEELGLNHARLTGEETDRCAQLEKQVARLGFEPGGWASRAFFKSFSDC